MVTFEQLKFHWDEICGKDEDKDNNEEWQESKNKIGVVGEFYFEYNWGESGILPVFNELIKIINEGKRVYLVEDPSCEGMMGMGYWIEL